MTEAWLAVFVLYWFFGTTSERREYWYRKACEAAVQERQSSPAPVAPPPAPAPGPSEFELARSAYRDRCGDRCRSGGDMGLGHLYCPRSG